MANADLESTNRLSERVLSSSGSIQLLNSHGEECILAFTPVDDTSGWTLISIVPANDLNVDNIRPNILLNTDDGTLSMVPVFSNTYGMLINNDIYEREGLTVPTTYSELVEVCSTLRENGYDNPIMGFSNEETTSLFTLSIYPYFCGTVAQDAEAVAALSSLDPSAGEYIRPSLEKIDQFLNDCGIDLEACSEIENNYDAVILRFFEGDVPMMTGLTDSSE